MKRQKLAFTMAEILLSLTIIGVVAAITLPSLTGNINERTWNTQRKALYARFSQAISLMPALNSYGVLVDGDTNNVAQTFIADGLSKVLKVNNVCDSDHLEDCGLPNKITPFTGSIISPFPKTLSDLNASITSVNTATSANPNGQSYTQKNTNAAAFETANGESIAVYYNPSCKGELFNISTNWDPAQARICVNFIYDLNGSKGPNTMGKDIGFISVFYPSDSVVVAPMPYSRDSGNAPQIASSGGKSGSQVCTAIDGGEYRLPNRNELAALFINRYLLEGAGSSNGSHYLSSDIEIENGTTNAVSVSLYSGAKIRKSRTASLPVRCIRR